MKLAVPNANKNDGCIILLCLSKEPGSNWVSVKVKWRMAQWLKQQGKFWFFFLLFCLC